MKISKLTVKNKYKYFVYIKHIVNKFYIRKLKFYSISKSNSDGTITVVAIYDASTQEFIISVMPMKITSSGVLREMVKNILSEIIQQETLLKSELNIHGEMPVYYLNDVRVVGY